MGRVWATLFKISSNILAPLMGGGEIFAQCRIGAGLFLPHRLNGTVIHSNAVLGDDVTLYHQVTVGAIKDTDGHQRAPIIGNRVVIYPGAKVLGGVCIGDGAVIGANAVVISDVPPGATVVTPLGRILEPKTLARES